MSIALTPEEIAELTNKRNRSAQERELRYLGIPCKPRRDGSLLVLRVHVEVEQAKAAPEPQLRLNS